MNKATEVKKAMFFLYSCKRYASNPQAIEIFDALLQELAECYLRLRGVI